MAGKRKAEGIALLSVYGGDDDDGASQASSSDDEEVEDANQERPVEDGSSPQTDGVDIFGSGVRSLGGDDGENQEATESPSSTHAASPGNLSTLQEGNAAEDGSTVQSSEGDGEDKTSGGEGEKVPESEPMELDTLNDFLPPVPAEKCSGELQAKFSKYLVLKKTGKSLNEQLRNTKGYRNPDFLQSAVRHYDIDHIGSCFRKEIFDPDGFDKSDYFDAIALEIRRETERKELERRQIQRVDFVRNSIQTAVAVAKPIVPLVNKVTTTVMRSETTVKAEGRSSKKSKWDKVEVDGARTAQTAADAIAAASAHAALLTATANAGAGYASFAQQRRREAEEKSRISEKDKLSSSSKPDRKTERS